MNGVTRLLDTCVLVGCGRPGTTAYEALARRAERNGSPYEIPPRVYRELGGEKREVYSTPTQPVEQAIESGWITVTPSPDYTKGVVSKAMDRARRFIAGEAGVPEDCVEKADTALVGIAATRLSDQTADRVEVYTGDVPAGRAAETVLPDTGFAPDRVEWVDGNEFVDELREQPV